MEPDGTKLRMLRQDRGLSVRGLASRAGVSTETVFNIERGKRDFIWPRTARKLAEALGVDPADLLK
jgi:transcriptional regulator with XRE-family HTH domain